MVEGRERMGSRSELTANNKPTNFSYLQRVNVIFYAYVPFLRRYYIVHSGTTCNNIIITRVVKFIFFPMRRLSYSFMLMLVPGEKQIYNNLRFSPSPPPAPPYVVLLHPRVVQQK